MFTGICVYAENNNNILDSTVSELVTAAQAIKEKTGESVKAILVAKECGGLIKQLEQLGFDEIYALETKSSCLFKDDSMSRVIAQILKKIRPSAVLIPASAAARSLFSRTAVLIGSGLTADCTALEVVTGRGNQTYRIKQNKPSFGDNVMVSITTKERCYPQMMTIRQGVYPPYKAGDIKPQIHLLRDIEIPESKIEVLEAALCQGGADSISSAKIVCVGGRGVLGGNAFELLQKFASKIGGVVAGTRPLSDEGIVPFEKQIGQTGKTIRPAICVSFGVSGAIQHTEGIKDTKLFIAVNNDENAAIFSISNYGAVADVKEILTCALEIL